MVSEWADSGMWDGGKSVKQEEEEEVVGSEESGTGAAVRE